MRLYFQFTGFDFGFKCLIAVAKQFLECADVLTRVYLRVVFPSAARRLVFATSTFLASRNPCHSAKFILTQVGQSIIEFSHYESVCALLLCDNLQFNSQPYRRPVMLGDTYGRLQSPSLLCTIVPLCILMHCFS